MGQVCVRRMEGDWQGQCGGQGPVNCCDVAQYARLGTGFRAAAYGTVGVESMGVVTLLGPGCGRWRAGEGEMEEAERIGPGV